MSTVDHVIDLEEPSPAQHRVGRRRGVVLIGVLALLVGLGGGYLLRWGLESGSTKTVTNPAYATSTTPSADVFFDGKACYYSGPAVVKAGATLSVTFTGRSAAVGALGIYAISPAQTWETVARDSAAGGAVTPPYIEPLSPTLLGAGTATVHLDVPGQYGVWCGGADSRMGTGTGPVSVATLLVAVK
jgi:hypothetical protein